ncbi:MAG: hypothetical protein J5957_13315 [Prevotella sp.]|nr:hypothetical protein [Prevotella sp.]
MMMNEQELDALIIDALERQQVLEEINVEVMREVRHTTRRQQCHRWARLVAFAFGMPLLFLCFLIGIYSLYTHAETQPYIYVCIILPSITMILFCIKEINHFSVKEV